MNRLQKSLILLVCFITLILVGVMGVWYNAQNQGLTSPLFFPPPDYLKISQPLPNQTYPIPPNGSLTICLWLSAKLLLQSDDKLVKSEWWHTNTKLWLDQIDIGNLIIGWIYWELTQQEMNMALMNIVGLLKMSRPGGI